ncbi:unnamed protein product [Phaeothamnion confervicola]
MSDAACKMMCGAGPGRRGPFHPAWGSDGLAASPASAYDIDKARRRLGRCVVGSLEHWADTKAVLLHWFPWLLISDDGIHHKSWWAEGVRETRAELRLELVEVILQHNRCDVELHSFAMDRFRAQLRVVEVGRGRVPQQVAAF